MRNDYRIEGDVAILALTQGQETKIDAADIPLVSGHRWHPSWNVRMRSYYVIASVKNALDRPTTLYLHRLITGAPKGRVVDHLNDDTLDNRRANLRVCGQRENIGRGKAKIGACPSGHAYDEANTYRDPDGARRCRACNRERAGRVYKRRMDAMNRMRA
jgi:hypothetical protein